MLKVLDSLKNWIIMWLGFMITVWACVFAYNYTGYYEQNEVNSWETITSESYNKIISSLRELKQNTDILMAKKVWTDIDPQRKIISNCLNPAPSTYTSPFNLDQTITLDKWIYFAYIHVNWLYWDIFYVEPNSTNVKSAIPGILYPHQEWIKFANAAIMFSVSQDNSVIPFKVRTNMAASMSTNWYLCYSIDTFKISN